MTDRETGDAPKIHDADRPSDTAGQPAMGDGASGSGYLRDVDTKNTEAKVPEPAEAPDPDGAASARGR